MERKWKLMFLQTSAAAGPEHRWIDVMLYFSSLDGITIKEVCGRNTASSTWTLAVRQNTNSQIRPKTL